MVVFNYLNMKIRKMKNEKNITNTTDTINSYICRYNHNSKFCCKSIRFFITTRLQVKFQNSRGAIISNNRILTFAHVVSGARFLEIQKEKGIEQRNRDCQESITLSYQLEFVYY